MSKRGSIYIKDIKKGKVTRRRGKSVDVDAKQAYAFVNKKAKQREQGIRTLAGVLNRVAVLSEKCESIVLESWPVRSLSGIVANSWPGRATRKLGDWLERAASSKRETN